jgi:chloramphenicol 3-O phosphotransferase
MGTPVVLLNGIPSAGKTTLARALCRALDEPAFHLSLDDFRMGIPERWWTGPGVAELFGKMMRSHLQALDAVAAEGVPVIAESIVLPVNRSLYQALFDRHDVLLIGVRCPLRVAQERERSRGDRVDGPIDLDVADFSLVHQQSYDLELDTSTEPTDRSVTRLLDLLAKRRRVQSPGPDLTAP